MWIVQIGEEHRDPLRPPLDEWQLVDLDESLPGCAFRGVGIDRMGTVLRTGVDVEPSDAPVYVSSFEKAWEYGEFPKLVLALDYRALDRTYREVSCAASPEERCAVQKDFPTVLESVDGNSLWYTRLPADDPGISTAYETEYARWIRGDPFEALRAVLVFASDGDVDVLAEAMSPDARNGD